MHADVSENGSERERWTPRVPDHMIWLNWHSRCAPSSAAFIIDLVIETIITMICTSGLALLRHVCQPRLLMVPIILCL